MSSYTYINLRNIISNSKVSPKGDHPIQPQRVNYIVPC